MKKFLVKQQQQTLKSLFGGPWYASSNLKVKPCYLVAFWFQRFPSCCRIDTCDLSDHKETWHDQQEDKDKDKNVHKQKTKTWTMKEQFSDLVTIVTQLTFRDKSRNSNHDIEI